MRLGIDLDGVVADFNAGWMRLHADEFGSNLHSDMVDSWDGLHRLGGFDDMSSFWEWAAPKEHRRSIFRHLEPYPGAVDALRQLRRQGHRIVIVTTKPRWAHTDTLRWLADNEIPTTEIHMTDHKFEVDCDAYLDDAPHVLEELAEHRAGALICRYIRAWNQPVAGTVDVTGWDQFHRHVTERSSNVST